MTGPVLEVEDATVTYGGVRAVSGVTLRVDEGAIVGVIGPNGAGKTSLVDGITGFTPMAGRVRVDGRDVTGWPTHRRVRNGLVRTWQSVELFDDLTVGENLEVAAADWGGRTIVRDLLRGGSRGVADDIRDALGVVGLTDHVGRTVGSLPHGVRKLVGVARALASRPRVLCLDEPAAGLDSGESLLLGERIQHIVRERACSVLLIDHDMDLVLGICDHVYVVEFGTLISAGTPGEVRSDPRVIAAYLGQSGGTADVDA